MATRVIIYDHWAGIGNPDKLKQMQAIEDQVIEDGYKLQGQDSWAMSYVEFESPAEALMFRLKYL